MSSGGAPRDAAARWETGFRSLIEQATAAHEDEVRRLRQEVHRLLQQQQQQQLRGAPVEVAPPAPGEESPGRGEHASQAPVIADSVAHAPHRDDGAHFVAQLAEHSVAHAPNRDDGAHFVAELAELHKRPSVQSVGSHPLPPTRAGGGGGYCQSLAVRLSRVVGDMESEQLWHGTRERGRLWMLVNSAVFEVVVGAAILTSGTLMALEAQYIGFDLARYTGHESEGGLSAEMWPYFQSVSDFAYWFFGVFFLLELIIKILALRAEFVRDVWNWIDSIIVLFWILGASFQNSSVNAQFLRLIRLARLVRLVRLLKFMRGHMSDSLFVMLAAIQDCLAATLWTVLLLIVVHAMLAIFMNKILVEYYFYDGEGPRGKSEVFMYFGSFSRSFLTMFEITFANWVVPTRALVEDVNELFTLYAVLHKCIIGVAAAAVIGAVFIQETFQVVQMDDAIMVRQALMREKSHSDKMHALFREIDKEGHGSVTSEEWESICENEWVQIWLRAQDIKARDAATLFQMVDNGEGQLTADKLIKGTAALKGTSAIMTILGELRETTLGVKKLQRELEAGRAQSPEATNCL